MALLDDVLSFLEDEGLVNDTSGWEGAASYLPSSPDRVLAVFETAGVPPEEVKAGSSETAYDEPGFQVRIRGERFGYPAMRTRLGAVYRALHASVLGAAGDYVDVRATQSGPSPLGLDEHSRPGATWNFRAHRRRGA